MKESILRFSYDGNNTFLPDRMFVTGRWSVDHDNQQLFIREAKKRLPNSLAKVFSFYDSCFYHYDIDFFTDILKKEFTVQSQVVCFLSIEIWLNYYCKKFHLTDDQINSKEIFKVVSTIDITDIFKSSIKKITKNKIFNRNKCINGACSNFKFMNLRQVLEFTKEHEYEIDGVCSELHNKKHRYRKSLLAFCELFPEILL